MKTLRRDTRRPARGPLRFRQLWLEELEPRVVLSGPSVSSVTPLNVINQTFDHITVQFNESIDPSSFTAGQVAIAGPGGAVTPTGITELASDTYEVTFTALSTRGIYYTTIGPGILDLSGNPISQPYNTALEYANASVVFTSATTISETDTTYDGQDICLLGTTVAINGPHNFDSVQLVSGAVLTHSSTTATQTHLLNLSVANQVIVDLTSRIDVTGAGYQPGYTTGNTTVGGATGNSGGSYGGLGASSRGNTNAVYGSYANPDDWGSGGNSSGGGLIQITAAALQLDGQVLANGGDSGCGYYGCGGSGSGGGIYLAIGSLQGQGLIQADGGRDGFGGGGGRIALYAPDFSSFNTANIQALGGNSAGAGTIYLKQTGQPQGTLIVDAANGGVGTTPLGVPGESVQPFPDAVILRGSRTNVVAATPSLELDFQNSLTVTNSATFTIAGADLVTEQGLTVTNSAQLVVSGAWSLTQPLTLTNTAQVQVSGMLTSSVPLTIDGSTLRGTQIVAPAVTVANGGSLTTFSATTSQVFALLLSISGTVNVDSTSVIDVTGEGYLPGYTTGNTTVGGATGNSAGSYGGLGAASRGNTNAVYGSYANPDDWGSGGNSSGGGLVQITAGALQLDGQLLANGGDSGCGYYGCGGSGAGGGIYLAVGSLQGQGLIHANGGRDGFGGGGGRIALYATNSNNFSLANVEAWGGNSAGAGTIYLKRAGDPQGTLIVDAGNGGIGTTPLGVPGESVQAFPDAVILQGSRTNVIAATPSLELDFQNSLTLTNAGTFSIAGPELVTEQGLTVTAAAQLIVSGTWGLTQPLTLTAGAQVQVSGALTASVPLTIDGGTLRGMQIVAPSLAVIDGGDLTTFSATTNQVFALVLSISGTVTVDAAVSLTSRARGICPATRPAIPP
jgi:hypothetical protein